MHNPDIYRLIDDNRNLFWSVRKEDLDKISLEAVVENFLNYADIKEIRTLIELTGIERVSQIFYKQISRKRNNYHKRTINFFILYFKRHAQRNIIS